MKRRFVLFAAVAFCAAITLGRVLFAPSTGSQDAQLADRDVVSPSVPNAAQSIPEGSSPEIELAKATSAAMRLRLMGNRDLFEVEGGIRNENSRLTHFFAKQSVEGTLHATQGGMKESIRWMPLTQQLRRGLEVASVLTTAQGQTAKVEKAGDFSRVVYAGTYQHTDERMYVRPDGGVEHDYVLSQPVKGVDSLNDLAYTGYLQMGAGFTLWDEVTNKKITSKFVTQRGVLIKNQSNNVVFKLLPPIAYDATVTNVDGTLNKEKQATSAYCGNFVNLQYQFDFDDSGVLLAVVAPGKWLSDAGRAFPVVIDPCLGPFGLADGDSPSYVGSLGSDVEIPVSSGGKKLSIPYHAGDLGNCAVRSNDGCGIIFMPFAFPFYGVTCPPGAPLYTHIDGFAAIDTNLPPIPPPFFKTWPPEVLNPSPYPSLCFDPFNTPIPYGWMDETNLGQGRNHYYTFFPYWDDLKFGAPATASTAASAIYYMTDGVAPDRRLVVEWYKMTYASSPNPTDVLSFNLILYECGGQIEYVIGQSETEVDKGLASVGLSGPSGIGIQYVYDGSVQDPVCPTIAYNTALFFKPSAVSNIVITPTRAAGCTPLAVCFNTTVTTADPGCGTGPSVTPSLGYHWIFDSARYVPPGVGTAPDARLDKGEAFTKDACHTFTQPGAYVCSLTVTDEYGSKTSTSVLVDVCRNPTVVISVSPQGGFAPLEVTMEARTPSDPNILLSGTAVWDIQRLGTSLEPGMNTFEATLSGNLVSHTFATGGIYRVTSTFNGTDSSTGTPVSGVGTAFVFVGESAETLQDGVIITDSQFNIDWKSKVPPVKKPGATGTESPVPLDPNKDTIVINGIINLLGVSQSDLAGHRVRVILNGVYPIFDGILDGSGSAIQGDSSAGTTGKFKISQPGGKFSCSTKGNLYGYLALTNLTESRLLPALYRIEIDGLFQSPAMGPVITYDYSSIIYKTGKGSYKFGMFSKQGTISGKGLPPVKGSSAVPEAGLPGGGRPGGQTVLVTGVFMATEVAMKLEGSTVSGTIKGTMSRFGGDGLQPASNSDVVVSIGGYSEALNFSTTPTFKTSGKVPFQKFSFKREGGLGVSGITSMQWVNGAGGFTFTFSGLPNELVGIKSALDVQTLTTGLTITPENGQLFQGTARYSLIKTSPEDFVRVLGGKR